jgi:hypothetical protein
MGVFAMGVFAMGVFAIGVLVRVRVRPGDF